MRIGRIMRLRLTYAFWRALGAKESNAAIAVVHESGFADIVDGNLTDEAVKDILSAKSQADEGHGYHRTD